jgi:hypothetical protein
MTPSLMKIVSLKKKHHQIHDRSFIQLNSSLKANKKSTSKIGAYKRTGVINQGSWGRADTDHWLRSASLALCGLGKCLHDAISSATSLPLSVRVLFIKIVGKRPELHTVIGMFY